MRHPFRKRKTLAVLRLSGVIAPRGRALNLESLRGPIDRAFKAGDEVALVVNCPGGSPAQSQLIHDHIRLKADKTGKRVTTFVEDLAASGGYWIALAGDKIQVLPCSLVGSIGVISAGFGFVEALDKLGVERRVVTSGPNKSRLDPFRPTREEDTEWLKGIQESVYKGFVAHVRARRSAQGAVLATDTELFNGDVWTGEAALALGLVDGMDSLTAHAQRANLRIKEIARKRAFPLSLLGASTGEGIVESLSAQVLDGVDAHLEDRALRARFGM